MSARFHARSAGDLTSRSLLPPHQDENFDDDDYESPYSGDDAESVEDYELPNDDMVNDYEPPPSQPLEELKMCPSLPVGDGDYIGKTITFYHNGYFMDRSGC